MKWLARHRAGGHPFGAGGSFSERTWHKPRLSLQFAPCERLLSTLLAAAVAVLPHSTPVRAEESETSSKVSTILVTFDPGAVEQARVVAAVRAHLSGLPVRVLLKPVARSGSVGQSVATAGALAKESDALGTFSIELGEDGAFLVFFTEPGGASALIRRLAPNDQGVRVTVEEAAIVVGSLVLALLEGRRIGMASAADASAKTERPEPAPERPSGPESPVESAPTTGAPDDDDDDDDDDGERNASSAPHTIAITAAYAGTDFSSSTRWQPGLTLGMRWIFLRPLHAAARYTFVPALEGGTDETSVSIARHPGELVIGYLGTTRLAATAELGVVLDYTSRRTQINDPAFEPTPGSSRWTVAFGARAGASFSVVPSIQLAARGGADWLVTRYAYVTPDARAVVRPYRVRPRLDLELAVNLW
jgi:hypothetical protein